MTDADAHKLLRETAQALVRVRPNATGNDVAAACWHVAMEMLEAGKQDDALTFMRVANAAMESEVMRQLLPKQRPKWRG